MLIGQRNGDLFLTDVLHVNSAVFLPVLVSHDVEIYLTSETRPGRSLGALVELQ